MSREAYLQAATIIPWLLKSVEGTLERSSEGDVVDQEFVRQHSTSRTPSREETALALKGLKNVGILRRVAGGLSVDRNAFDETRGYRRGVWDALASRAPIDTQFPTLCVALPPQIPREMRERVAKHAPDLRSAIVSVIAAAKRRLVLASPFWDVKTATEIGELAKRRSGAGVTVDILTRSAADRAATTLIQMFAGAPGFRLFKWYEPAPAAATTTFHFKAVVADDGQRAYVGTANLTQASLRSTMELGFIMGSDSGRHVAGILDAVIDISELLHSSGSR